jgi:peptidoglycan/LPS O-acetylase OafA/YrhL
LPRDAVVARWCAQQQLRTLVSPWGYEGVWCLAVAPTHRNDIDGLRAVAVSWVMMCHLSTPGFSGGYVGVDVFFVISGFLLWRTLRHEVQRSRTFSAAHFFERRLRRIWPATFATLMLTALVATFVLVPPQLLALAKSTGAATAFLANVYFWTTSGYFDPEGASRPLLHLWSLGVEEQFYLFFPLLAWALVRSPSRWRVGVWVLWLLSFVASAAWMWRSSSSGFANHAAVFYLLPFRAWEFLSGILVAEHDWQQNKPPSKTVAFVAAVLGCVCLVAAAVVYNNNTLFPGPFVLPVVAAATLLLRVGQHVPWLMHVLSAAPLTWLGRRSFGLYLAHWPLLVLLRIGCAEWSMHARHVVVLVLSLVLADASHRWLERPIQQRRLLKTRKRLVAAVVGSVLLAWGVAAILVIGNASSDLAMPRAAFEEGTCLLTASQDNDKHAPHCLQPHADKRVLLFGDSHAAQYAQALRGALQADGIAVGMLARTNCAPHLSDDDTPCASLVRAWLAQVRAQPPLAVVLAGRFASVDFDAVLRLVRALQQLQVPCIVIGDGPEFVHDTQVMRATGKLVADESDVSPTIWTARLRWPSDITLVDPVTTLCPNHACPLVSSLHEPLYFDNTHLTAAGSKLVVPMVVLRIYEAMH